MSKRISIEALEFDKKIIELSYADSAESNSELLKKVKKIMLQIIKNDLTPRQKEIIMLYYFKNMNTVEIARMLNVDSSTVSRTLCRARRNLLDRLKYYF